MFVLLLGEMPSLRPLLPVVLPFNDVPVVVELAAGPPEAELPPADAPAPVPALCANEAVVPSKMAATDMMRVFFMLVCLSSEQE